MSALEGLAKRCFFDQTAPSAVDDTNTRPCSTESFRSKNMPRLGGEGSVQRNKIGCPEQIVELVYELDLQAARARGGEIWIKSEDAHAEGDGAPAQFASNPAHP